MRIRNATGRAITVTLLTLLASGCGPTAAEKPIKLGPVETGAGTLASARRFLAGRWQLESFEIHPPGQPPVALTGSGTLVYDDMSNLRMEIRADEAGSDTLRAAGIDIRDGMISTDGRAVIDVANRTLTYVLEGQAPLVQRGPLAMQRPRHWVVDANTLTLTTRDEAGRPLSIARWTRMP
jgi:hypothetical protein